jgi:hypothetical protein
MSNSWLPSNDGLFLTFSQNMSAKITATPLLYGFSVPEAVSLASAVTSF